MAGTYTVPTVYARKEPGYNWGSFVFWEQWTVIAILAASAFLEVGPLQGLCAQAATALVSVPLACLWKRPSIRDKVARYRENAANARKRNLPLPPPATSSPLSDLMRATFEGCRIHRIAFASTLAVLAAGIGWTAMLHRPLLILLAVPAAVVGCIAQMMVACPKFTPQDEIAKRGLDVDLVRDFVKFRVVVTFHMLLITTIVIMGMGGRDPGLLAALSLLVAGSFNLANAVDSGQNAANVDWLFMPVYLLSYAAVFALYVVPLHWTASLLPVPLFSVLVPAFRWFFPRSGLRGEERRAAIAEMPARLKADIRTDAEKKRDEKAEKRRRRNERRVASIRRSRGELG